MPNIERTIQPTETDKAYAAGFIDGEGSLGVVPKPYARPDRFGNPRPPSIRVQVYVGQDNTGPLQFIGDRWGGTLHEDHRAPSGRAFWRLNFSHESAMRLIADIYPYLIVKRKNADHLILVSATCFFPGTGGRYSVGRTPQQVADQVWAVEESRRLNART